ncbi:MAG: hypothetical protein JWQ14_2204, partial [Adhaeribacter sp.]|nr:hypothetical protein [Adhaeribacter sp.]
FEDNLTIEKFFGKVIEPTYNKLIKAINTRESLNTWEIKILFLQWIVYNKLRSPIFRNDLEVQIKLLYQNSGDLSAPDSIIVDKIVKRYAKQLHLNYFLNLNKLADYVNLMVAGLMVKEWKILIAPD